MLDKFGKIIAFINEAKEYADKAADVLDTGLDALEKVTEAGRRVEEFLREIDGDTKVSALPPEEQEKLAALCDELHELQVECEIAQDADTDAIKTTGEPVNMGPIAQAALAEIIKRLLERVQK